MLKRIAVFVLSLASFAGLAWLGGYNFDERNLDVAFYTFFAIGFSICMGTCPYLEGKND
jgi:hypothetical protein